MKTLIMLVSPTRRLTVSLAFLLAGFSITLATQATSIDFTDDSVYELEEISSSPPLYVTTIPTGTLHVILNVTDGITTTETVFDLGGVEGAAFGEVVGVLNPTLELSEFTFEVLEGGTLTDLLGSSEIPVLLTIDPGASWEYESLNPSFSTVDPLSDLKIDTTNVTTFALSGEIELLGELIPFSFTRADVVYAPGQYNSAGGAMLSNTGGWYPQAEADSGALSEFWLVTYLGGTQHLRTRGELMASDFAEVQGLSLTLRAHLGFGATEIHYLPEPSGSAMIAAGVGVLGVLYRRRARG
jgi:hypothetical protein